MQVHISKTMERMNLYLKTRLLVTEDYATKFNVEHITNHSSLL